MAQQSLNTPHLCSSAKVEISTSGVASRLLTKEFALAVAMMMGSIIIGLAVGYFSNYMNTGMVFRLNGL